MQDQTGTTESGVDDSASTVLVEVLPGVAVVAGEVPPDLKPDLIDFGMVPSADRRQISAVLAAIGNATALAGNLGTAYVNAQGLLRLSSATQTLLRNGATLATKDGAYLGTVIGPGGVLHQARFHSMSALGKAAPVAASVGPALALVALEMMLHEVSGLVRSTLAATNKVLTAIRKEQWAELTGLVAVIDRAVEEAREVEPFPASLWDSVAGSGPLLEKQLELYQGNVRGHVAKITEARARREYLQTNADVIAFDVFALLSALNAWTGYHALRAAKARAAGAGDAAEAQYAEHIAQTTREAFDRTLAEMTRVVDALVQELRLTVELRGSDSWSLPGRRKDAQAARETAAKLLEQIGPLADALHPPVPPLRVPDVVCGPEPDLEPYLRVLRWLFEDGETLRAIGFPEPLDDGPLSSIVGGARGRLAAVMDKPADRPLVAVTDRRIILTTTGTFLEQAGIHQDIPLGQVRYVRAPEGGSAPVIDLITRDENIRWLFHTDVARGDVAALAAVLAESMAVPDAEREALLSRRVAAIEAASA